MKLKFDGNLEYQLEAIRAVTDLFEGLPPGQSGIPFEEKMSELSTRLYKQFEEADQLEAVIIKNLEFLGYGK